jgi:mono/diheme cytochrome c family protein
MRGVGRLLAVLGMAMFAAEVRAASGIELPPGPDRDLVYGQCRTCHDLQYLVDSAGIPRASWAAVLDDMRQYGLRMPPEARDKILQYLAAYLGPNPPPAPTAATPPGAAPADGQTVYTENCAACHQADGRGVAGQFPPLAGNPDLFLDRLYPVYVVLNGLEGPLTVEGLQFGAAMPAFGHLSDAGVAAVVNYVRAAWDNGALRPGGMAEVDAAAVTEARHEAMTPQEVLAYRADRR